MRFEIGSVHELPFAHRSFDAAFAHTLLVHLASREHRSWRRRKGSCGSRSSTTGGDPHRARHHRSLLLETGFVRPVAGASLGTGGVFGTDEDTRFAAVWLAEQIRAPAFANLVLKQGWLDAPTFEAVLEEVLAWGERPDAFRAVMGVTAIGWVEAATTDATRHTG